MKEGNYCEYVLFSQKAIKDTDWQKAKAQAKPQFHIRITECEYHINEKELPAIYKGICRLCLVIWEQHF